MSTLPPTMRGRLVRSTVEVARRSDPASMAGEPWSGERESRSVAGGGAQHLRIEIEVSAQVGSHFGDPCGTSSRVLDDRVSETGGPGSEVPDRIAMDGDFVARPLIVVDQGVAAREGSAISDRASAEPVGHVPRDGAIDHGELTALVDLERVVAPVRTEETIVEHRVGCARDREDLTPTVEAAVPEFGRGVLHEHGGFEGDADEPDVREDG